jgi:hypothetical protein
VFKNNTWCLLWNGNSKLVFCNMLLTKLLIYCTPLAQSSLNILNICLDFELTNLLSPKRDGWNVCLRGNFQGNVKITQTLTWHLLREHGASSDSDVTLADNCMSFKIIRAEYSVHSFSENTLLWRWLKKTGLWCCVEW